jgi:hypothetical protein
MRVFSGLTTLILMALGSVVFVGAVERDLDDGWVRFALTGKAYAPAEWGASSVLEADNFWDDSRYDPGKALDGTTWTAWVEGAPGPGIGESIVLAFPDYPEALGFINGFARNPNLFGRNHRVKALNLSLYTAVNVDGFATETVTLYDALPVGRPERVTLADTRESQRISLPIATETAITAMERFRSSDELVDWNFPQAQEMGVTGETGIPLRFRYIVKLEIAEVYRGTTWEDTCIAEIWPDYGAVTAVTTSDNQRQLILTIPDGRNVAGYADFESVLTVADIDDTGQWALLIKEPAYSEAGRVSSEYSIVHLPTGRDMTAAILPEGPGGKAVGIPYGFDTDGNTVYVLYDEISTGKENRAPCPAAYTHQGSR